MSNAMTAKHLNLTVKNMSVADDAIEFIKAWDYEAEPLKIKLFGAGSTLDYKAVFWIWMRAFAKQFNDRGRPTDKEGKELHNIFCYRFLGIVPPKTYKNGDTLPEMLRTITYPKDLNKGQWYDFMRQIEELAQTWGLTIPENDNNEYAQDKLRQVA